MTAEEPKYTLVEARALLRREHCRTNGHSLDAIMTPGGDVASYVCDNCGTMFVPVDEITRPSEPQERVDPVIEWIDRQMATYRDHPGDMRSLRHWRLLRLAEPQ